MKRLTIIITMVTAISVSIGVTKYIQNKNMKTKIQAMGEIMQIDADRDILQTKYYPFVILSENDRIYKGRQIDKDGIQKDIIYDCKNHKEISNVQVSKEQLDKEKQELKEYTRKNPTEIKNSTTIGNIRIIENKDGLFVTGVNNNCR